MHGATRMSDSVIKSTGHAGHVVEIKIMCISVGKPERKRPLSRPRCKWQLIVTVWTVFSWIEIETLSTRSVTE